MKTIEQRLRDGERLVVIGEKRKFTLFYHAHLYWLRSGESKDATPFANADELVAFVLECVGCWHRASTGEVS